MLQQGGMHVKLTLHIGTGHEEEVIVYADCENEITRAVKKLFDCSNTPLFGYRDEIAVALNLSDVHCFSVENNHVFAYTQNEKLRMKQRLYQIETILTDQFVKINQSCIVNIAKIDRFDASITGTLSVRMQNGYKEYVSRRNIKSVKERLGL